MAMRHDPRDEPDEAAGPVLLGPVLVGPLDALAGLGHGGVDEPGAEDVEDRREVLDEGGAGQDEDQAQHQGDDDARQQHLLLVGARHPEGGEHDDEDEEVVDAQRLLGDVAGEVLLAVPPAPHGPHDGAEGAGHGDVGRRPGGRLPHGGLVGGAHMADDVDRDHGQDDRGQGDPSEGVDVHGRSFGTGAEVPKVSSRRGPRRTARTRGLRRRGRGPEDPVAVMTTSPLVGVLPSEWSVRV